MGLARSFGLGPETFNESHLVGDLSFRVDPGLLVHLFLEIDLIPRLLGATGKLAELLSVDRQGVGGDGVHELSIMGDQQQCSSPLAKKPSKPAQADDVEIVVGFVEE